MTRLVTLLLLAAPLLAQLRGDARIHRGDDLRWADPAFDDSAWETVASKGLPTWEDFAVNRIWSRSRVVIPNAQPVALVTRFCMCELYLNGVRIGATGDLNAPRPSPGRSVQVFWLPASIPPGPALLAVREYLPPGYEAVSALWRSHFVVITPGSEIVPTLERTERVGLSSEIAILQFFLLILVMVVLAGQKVDLLALLISAYLLVSSLNTYLYSGIPTTDFFLNFLVGAFCTILSVPLVVFLVALLSGAKPRAFWVVPYLVLHFGFRGLWILDYLRPDPAPWTSAFIYIYPGLYALALMIATVFLIAGWRRPATPRFLVAAGVATLLLSLLGRFGSGFGVIPMGIPMFGRVLIWDRFANLSFSLLAAIYLIERARTRRTEELRLKGELKAAQSVQALLLGQSLPTGVEAVYLPASEVGGDFYQVLPHPDGSTLFVVGDVSGKGLKAALVVSMMTGVARAHAALSPAALLAEMNHVAGFDTGGFITCLACRIDPGGSATIANAGHLGPYRNGAEVPTDSGLPLGIDPGATYTETHLQLQPFETLTFVTDGVVEAENHQRELFGFDRTREISTKSAWAIAESAKAWGQNDDITVVTVRRTA